MNKYNTFIFKDYHFDKQAKVLRLYYSFDGILEFCETYKFNFDFVDFDEDVLDRTLFTLFILAGVSYYKTYLAPNIVVDKGYLDPSDKEFFTKTYTKGLGEFFFKNNLDPDFKINFPFKAELKKPLHFESKGKLVGIGGGKDSIVSAEFMKESGIKLSTWSLDHMSQLEPLVKVLGTSHYYVERDWDKQLIELNAKDALNGHVPISAIFAAVGSIVAVLTGSKEMIVSNEQSSNEASMEYKGVDINHQYSKSTEFETSYQQYLKNNFGDSIVYYSLLRPFSELFIVELFSRKYFEKYRHVFSSCNNAYTHERDRIYWCGKCPKCAFMFLAFTPFINRDELEKLWGKNLVLDSSLHSTYLKILGIEPGKPLDCVGEIKESRVAVQMAKKIYPELSSYRFDIPSDYSYKDLGNHNMPDEMFSLLKNWINI